MPATPMCRQRQRLVSGSAAVFEGSCGCGKCDKGHEYELPAANARRASLSMHLPGRVAEALHGASCPPCRATSPFSGAPRLAARSTAYRISGRTGRNGAQNGCRSRSRQAHTPLVTCRSRSLLPTRDSEARISCGLRAFSKRRAAHALRANAQLSAIVNARRKGRRGMAGILPRSHTVLFAWGQGAGAARVDALEFQHRPCRNYLGAGEHQREIRRVFLRCRRADLNRRQRAYEARALTN
jgi:hypothetical protein